MYSYVEFILNPLSYSIQSQVNLFLIYCRAFKKGEAWNIKHDKFGMGVYLFVKFICSSTEQGKYSSELTAYKWGIEEESGYSQS